MTEIQEALFELRDPVYAAFNAKLIPNIEPKTIIGVRSPALRTLAKSLRDSSAAASFLEMLPHTYFEENNLHALLLSAEKTFDSTRSYLDAFLPYVDNWATCDSLNPVSFKKEPELTADYAARLLESSHLYTVRFGIGTLMRHFLDARFDLRYPNQIAALRSDEYYLNMMIAWYFATALCKQYEQIVPFLETKKLQKWTHNKTIQKAVESFRITEEQKNYLRTLRIK